MKKNDICTIIAATNRMNSNTLAFAKSLQSFLKKKGIQHTLLLDLKELEGVPIQNEMFDVAYQHPKVKELQDKYIIPAKKFVFVSPEYNGSYPGLLKYFIDACSIRRYDDNFMEKSAFLIGISTGRAGNLRGLEHLTGVLHYLKTHVYPFKMPISKIDQMYDKDNYDLKDEELIKNLEKELVPFVRNGVTV
jgi:NAD(P)H-dependent FMN reductase